MTKRSSCDAVTFTFALAGIIAIGCQRASDPIANQTSASSEVTTAIVDGETPTQEQKQVMLAAKDALFQELSGRLMDVMGTQGPAAAIAVCKNEATKIAQEVGDSYQLKIGRTGVRLRNPNNQAPAWAATMTQDKVDTPQFVSLTSGEAAALLPIKLQAQCLMCHGPKEQIAPIIGEQLSKLYPSDEATGFAEGELRGWFWIEMPPT